MAIGVDISISEIVGLGLSATISETTAKTLSQGVSEDCPKGPWKCAIAIYPYLLEVSGYKKSAIDSRCYSHFKVPPSGPYTVRLPIIGESGGVKSRVEVCACKNFKHWADNGAPSIVCDGCA